MSTIGYGDISAVTERERVIACFVMFVGCALFAWTTGKLTSVLTKTSICESQFNRKMEELNEYMAARALPQDLIKKLKSFYMLKFPTRRIFHEHLILEDLPLELRKEIHLELFRDVVAMSPLFRACSVDVRREVCYRMRPEYKEAGRSVMKAGEVPGALYIVRHGRVEIESRGETLMIAERGTLFGENALLGLTQGLKRTRSATTLTLCELAVLEANDLQDLLVLSKDFHQVRAPRLSCCPLSLLWPAAVSAVRWQWQVRCTCGHEGRGSGA
jgi:CRP-like cAMP-binding protein